MAHLDYLCGRLIARGVDPSDLSARDWLDVAYATMIDMADGMVDRDKIKADLDDVLAREVVSRSAVWGADPQAQAGQRAMMRAAGGPAPMRPPDAKRPAAWNAREEANPT